MEPDAVTNGQLNRPKEKVSVYQGRLALRHLHSHFVTSSQAVNKIGHGELPDMQFIALFSSCGGVQGCMNWILYSGV